MPLDPATPRALVPPEICRLFILLNERHRPPLGQRTLALLIVKFCKLSCQITLTLSPFLGKSFS